jgi:DNA-directed RNA polymerase specialized sigma24 family protein
MDKRDKRNLEQLTPRELEVITLQKAGYSYKQISAVLGIAETTIKGRIIRAREKSLAGARA